MTTRRPVSGWTANWTLEPPVSTPISRSTAIEALRIIWYSLSVSVSAGATVIESPVWTPIGSMFSIEQTMMQLSRLVADHLHLELLPAEQALVDEDLGDRRGVEAGLADALEVLAVVGDAAAGAAEGEGGADDRGQADVLDGGQRLVDGVGDGGLGVLEADAVHRLAEELAVLGHLDGLALGADQLDAELGEHAHVVERQRGVEAGLAAHRRQERVGALLLDDLGDDLRGDRLDVGGVGHLRVGHDRRGVGVDQDDAVALLAQRLAGLGAGVVELAGLADDDRPRADDHDRADVGSLRHGGLARSARAPGRRRGRGFARGRQIGVVIEGEGGGASA